MQRLAVAVVLVCLLWQGAEGQTVVAREGDTATFNDASITGTGDTIVSTADGRQLMQLDIFGSRVFPEFQSRVEVTNFDNGFRDSKASFIIRGVQRRDAGQLLCKSQFDSSAQPCGSATLVVAGKPSKPTLNILTSPVVVGSDVIVECQSQSTSVPPTSVLQLRYNLKENGRLALREPTSASRFKISNVSRRKAGHRYNCVAYEQNTATNQLTGVQSDDSDVYVMNPLYPPESPVLNPSVSSIEVSSDDNLPDVTCSADCNPACSLDWYKDSQIFQAGDTLRLGKADQDKAGNYFCRARNSLDTQDTPLIITIKDKVSRPTLVPPRTQYTVPEGSQVDDIFCRADCTPACTYEWLKDGQPLLESPGIRLGTVGPASSGTYTCRASNGQDTSETTFVLDVQYPPKAPRGRELIAPSPTSYRGEEGALFLPDVTCKADCNPACTERWTKGGSGSASSSNILSLGTAGRDDTGVYTCTATNSLGSLTAIVDINIEYRPEQVAFEPPNPRYVVVEDDDVIPDVICSAVCNPPCQYEWYRGDGSPVVSQTAVLSLGNADRSGDGTYTCRASNKLGQAAQTLNVEVLYGPRVASLSPPQPSYTVSSGTLLPPVTCSADCKPRCSFVWVKDDQPNPVTTSATLTLGQAEQAKAGIYLCRALNDHGSASAKFDLAVQFGPSSTITLTPPLEVYNLSEGDDLTVTCDATCDPPCLFRWERRQGGGVPVGDSTLKLDGVTQGDAGTYRCVADNGVGVPASKAILVNILSGPSGKVKVTPAGPVSIKQGNSVVLTCEAECSPACGYRWLKDSQDLPASNGILTLNDVKRSQNGDYVCVASNTVGSDGQSVKLIVQYGPGNSLTFIPERTSYPVEEDSDLLVTCQADCEPACDYVWRRRGSTVAQGSELSVGSVQRDQAGAYSCTADNAVGRPATRQIQVDILYGPDDVRMFPADPEVFPVLGSSVSLKCWAECSPPCSYTWFRGSLPLPEAVDGELDLRNLTTADSGSYQCQASNRVGDPKTRAVVVNVISGPGTTIRFIPPDPEAVVVEGRGLSVECVAACFPPCRYEWRRGSQLVSALATLDLQAVDRTQAGAYLCLASNDAASQASKPLTVTVEYGPGDSISLFPPGRNQSYAEGAPFSIKCTAECQPACSYQWYLGPSLLDTEGGVLASDAARMDQAGTYSCRAANDVGSASSAFVTIDVQTGPGKTLTFVPPGDRRVVREGEAVLVTCSADCSPACSYQWLKDSRPVDSSGGRLDIPTIARAQRGTYSCVADNGLGSQGTKPLTIDVQYGPEGAVEVFPSDRRQVLNEGASTFLKCTADCSPSCFYTWFLGNELANSTDGVLSLVAVGPEDAGTYRCSAENSIGLDSSDVVNVVVQTGPGNTVRIEPEGELYNVTEGGRLRLRCSAVCSPDCTYTWYYGSERVKSLDGRLVIDDMDREQAGSFVCYAANDAGLQGSRLIQVDVLYGPVAGVVLDPATDVTVTSDSPFSLRCSAECRPSCAYTWFKGPSVRQSEGGKLFVGRASDADEGSYTCRAANDVGDAVSDSIAVIVQYGPRDTIQLEPAGPSLVVTEGDDVTVTCSAECKPECQYSWFAGSQPVTSEQGVLTLPSTSRGMPRFYSCFADNGMGNRAMAALEIQVQYGPGDRPTLFPAGTGPISVSVGGSVSVQCTADCNPPCSLTWSDKQGQTVATSSPGVLQLDGVRRGQAGSYTCTAQNPIAPPATASVDIRLTSGPGASVRFLPPGFNQRVAEGDSLQVTCLAECVPECDTAWTRDGVPAAMDRVLLLTSVRRDQAGLYVCTASNDRGVNVTKQLTVDVEYGPADTVKLFPPEKTRNLNRGETLTVRCSALCSPPCDYTWTKDTQPLATEEGVLLVPNVTPDDRGSYSCRADNQAGPPSSVELTVNVNFGPEDSVTFDPPGNTQQLIEGQNLRVLCSARCVPACRYTWYRGTRPLPSRDGLLALSSVTRQDAGTYSCHADNGVGRRRVQDLLLDVEYPPNTPTFAPTPTSYTLSERIDRLADIRCVSDCNPRCDVRWLKDGLALDLSANILSLPETDRSVDGVYTCIATNIHGSRQKELTINVNFAPSITVFAINDRRALATVPETYPVTLNCRVASKPPSTVQLYFGNRLIKEVDNTEQAKLAWPRASCVDEGTYSCRADNGVGPMVSVSAELNVLCSPRLDPRQFLQPFVAAEQGQTAVIKVPVLANPTPSFFWYKVRDGVPSIILESSNDTQGQSDKFFTVNGSTSTLTIENVQLADFGDYVVSIANARGSQNFTFSLVPQSPPYQARNLTARGVGPQTVEVTWSPGFNGGARQQFMLEYLKHNTNGWRLLELDPRIDDVVRKIAMNVSDLNPGTRYTFRLRSKNVHGLSNYSNAAVASTHDSLKPPVSSGEVNPTPVLLGVGLALGFLVGAGITAIVVVSRCRPKTRRHHRQNTIDDFRSDTTYDTLYLRDALWAKQHIKMRHNSDSGLDNDGFDFKQPDDTVRGFNDYSSTLKPVGEMRTSL